MEEEARRPARERIESYFGDPETRTPKETEAIEKLVQVDQLLTEISSSSQGPGQRPLIEPTDDWYSPGASRPEIWRDRLAVQEREAASEDQSLKAATSRSTSVEKRSMATQDRSVWAGFVQRRYTLAVFQDWLGKDFDVAKIDEEVLEGFHEHLLEKVAAKTWSGTTASDCMSSVKSFVRWLWVKKAIANLPRTLDPKCKDL